MVVNVVADVRFAVRCRVRPYDEFLNISAHELRGVSRQTAQSHDAAVIIWCLAAAGCIGYAAGHAVVQYGRSALLKLARHKVLCVCCCGCNLVDIRQGVAAVPPPEAQTDDHLLHLKKEILLAACGTPLAGG